MTPAVDIRRAGVEDDEQVLALVADSLGWRPDDPNAEFFAWKHRRSPFGPSPAWVAVTPDGSVVGFRTFMRWEFTDAAGRVMRAVRAVDTATRSDFRGRGIFRDLTTAALGDLRRDGVDLVFNTPNDQSRPGYLSMGWVESGRLPMAARPRSLAAVPTVVRARTPAELWSEHVSVGVDPNEFFAADRCVPERGGTAGRGIATRRSAAFLRWRYGFAPLGYRVLPLPDGHIVVRVRRRGPARELALLEHAGPRRQVVRGVRAALRACRADHAVALGRVPGLVPVPRLGPLLTTRAVCSEPPRGTAWALTLGDVELF